MLIACKIHEENNVWRNYSVDVQTHFDVRRLQRRAQSIKCVCKCRKRKSTSSLQGIDKVVKRIHPERKSIDSGRFDRVSKFLENETIAWTSFYAVYSMGKVCRMQSTKPIFNVTIQKTAQNTSTSTHTTVHASWLRDRKSVFAGFLSITPTIST